MAGKKISKRQREEIISRYASSGWNNGWEGGKSTTSIYQDAIDAGLENEARLAYETAYTNGVAAVEQQYGVGKRLVV